jgi:hypothetical protein
MASPCFHCAAAGKKVACQKCTQTEAEAADRHARLLQIPLATRRLLNTGQLDLEA